MNYNFGKLKTDLADMSVKSNLMAMILSVTIICTILTVLAFSVYGVVNIRKEMKEELSITGTIISNRINAALIFNNNSLALETLGALSANPSIKMACVYDANNSVFAQFFSGKYVNGDCPVNPAKGVLFQDKQLQLYKEITDHFNNDIIGTLYISSDLNQISSFINKQIMIALFIIICVIGVAYMLATKVQNIISQPIRYLVKGDENVGSFLSAESRYFKSGNELIQLESLFNGMRDRIMFLEHKANQKHDELEEMLQNSESTFSYLNNELKKPLESTMAFGDIINSRSIGKIDEEYVSYFNDVYLSVYYYYGIMNDTMNFFKRHLREHYKQYDPELNVTKLLTGILKEIDANQPEYLEEFDFRYNIVDNPDLPKMVIERFVVKEIVVNAIFIYVKYLNFLDIKHLNVKLKTKIDDSDSDAVKFNIDIICKEMESENISNVLENHREYQNDVHLIRAKLQFLKYLAAYNGAYLDFGDDMRYLFKMVLMYPINQVTVREDNHPYEHYILNQRKIRG